MPAGGIKTARRFCCTRINPLRLKLTRTATGGLAGKRLFDLGCGGGIFPRRRRRRGRGWLRLTLPPAPLPPLFAPRPKAVAGLITACIRALPTAMSALMMLLLVLKCWNTPIIRAAGVADVSALLAPGGTAVFSTINRGMRSRALMIAGLEKILNILPSGVFTIMKNLFRRRTWPVGAKMPDYQCGALSACVIRFLAAFIYGRCGFIGELFFNRPS